MSELDERSSVPASADQNLPRPAHGHGPDRDPSGPAGPEVEAVDLDLHPAWLREWRCLRAQIEAARRSRGRLPPVRERVRWLQDAIAHTQPRTVAGLLAQAELIADLAWNDVVAAAARHLVAGIRRLQTPGSR